MKRGGCWLPVGAHTRRGALFLTSERTNHALRNPSDPPRAPTAPGDDTDISQLAGGSALFAGGGTA